AGCDGPAERWGREVIMQPEADIVEDMVAASAGTYNGPTPLASSGWLMQVAAFRTGPPPTSGGGGNPPPPSSGGIGFVQENYACPQTPQSEIAVTYPAAQ